MDLRNRAAALHRVLSRHEQNLADWKNEQLLDKYNNFGKINISFETFMRIADIGNSVSQGSRSKSGTIFAKKFHASMQEFAEYHGFKYEREWNGLYFKRKPLDALLTADDRHFGFSLCVSLRERKKGDWPTEGNLLAKKLPRSILFGVTLDNTGQCQTVAAQMPINVHVINCGDQDQITHMFMIILE